MPIICMPLKT